MSEEVGRGGGIDAPGRHSCGALPLFLASGLTFLATPAIIYLPKYITKTPIITDKSKNTNLRYNKNAVV